MATCPECEFDEIDTTDHEEGDELSCPECGKMLVLSGPDDLEVADDDDEDDDDEDYIGGRSLRRSIKRRPQVGGLVLPPAICLMVTGLIGAGINLFQFLIPLIDPEMLQGNNPFGGADAPPWLSAVFGLIFTLLALGTMAGAAAMMAKKYYGLAMTGTIFAMINIGNCCCVLGLPFGIWALVILCRPDVKDAYM